MQTIEKIFKSFESNVVPRERCLDNIRVGKTRREKSIVIVHVDLKASGCTHDVNSTRMESDLWITVTEL